MANKTGKKLYMKLEQYDTETGEATGVTKYNTIGDEDRIDPFDSVDCAEDFTYEFEFVDAPMFVCEGVGQELTYEFSFDNIFGNYVCDI